MSDRTLYRIVISLFIVCILCCTILLARRAPGNQKPIQLPPPFQAEEAYSAEAALKATGILTNSLTMEDTISRALFIRLIVGALGAEPVTQNLSFPGETWYSPYVKAGYAIGLFENSTTNMSFTPTNGFLMGTLGYSDMELPITRHDALTIITNALPPENQHSLSAQLELEILNKYFSVSETSADYLSSPLTCGEAVICAYKLMEEDLALPTQQEDEIASLEDCIREGRILHAGGRISSSDGKVYTYTNSAEALVNAYRAGNRVMEFDFMQTSDNHLALIHDWSNNTAPTISNGEPLCLEDWLQTKIYNNFTPLCLESLVDFMREHPDLYIITDIKDNNVDATAIIAATCPDLLDRFVIQIYKDSEYTPISQLGFKNIIYTLYNLPKEQKEDTAHLVAFAAENPLVGYTYPDSWREVPGYTEEMKQAGVMLFVHTINDLSEIEACYSEGITAVYTDIVEKE